MRKLKIVVGGYVVGFPLGGQVWLIMHFLQGLSRLGHDVIFVEDTSNWAMPFDPYKGFATADSRHGRDVLEMALASCGLGGRWSYNSQFENRRYGIEEAELDRFCEGTDLFLNISGVIPLDERFLKAKVRAIIDTDPIFMQDKIANDAWTRDYFLAHDVAFTFGWNIPAGSTGVPLSGIEYMPTRVPVVLDRWKALDTPGTAFTTIGSWDSKGRDIVLDGKKLSWRKCEKYEQIIDLPSMLPGVTLDLTMGGLREDAKRFAEHGWNTRDALEISSDIWRYHDYIANSLGEFTVAKEQNIQLKSGWFSDRSATYLASGRPVIVEDTGFGTHLPVGEGLVTFEGVDHAKEAIELVMADYEKHRRAARRIAEEHFDASKVLFDLLKNCGF